MIKRVVVKVEVDRCKACGKFISSDNYATRSLVMDGVMTRCNEGEMRKYCFLCGSKILTRKANKRYSKMLHGFTICKVNAGDAGLCSVVLTRGKEKIEIVSRDMKFLEVREVEGNGGD